MAAAFSQAFILKKPEKLQLPPFMQVYRIMNSAQMRLIDLRTEIEMGILNK